MDPGLLGALIGTGATVGLSGVGSFARWVRSLYKIIKTQEGTIADLRAQRDMLKVSAELQDKLLSELRPHIQRKDLGGPT